MSLKINTNIAALNAHRNMIKTDNGLSKSLERLSSGLRINKAADDASGMSIADSLKAQALGLGQAISNANDGISMVQIADGALEESTNIVNTIRTKALQAASDGQNDNSRAAIQRDIDKLLEEMDNIANTTKFNGLNLLDGTFTNKKIQIGAYSNETVSISIGEAKTSAVGTLDSLETTSDQTDLHELTGADGATSVFSNNYAGVNISTSATTGIKLNDVDLANYLVQQKGDQLSAKGFAAAVNAASDSTGGVKASAITNVTGSTSVTAGTLNDGALYINGVSIGEVDVKGNDADHALTDAINKKSGETGVVATVNGEGVLTLTALDGRNIALGSGSGGKNAITTGTGSTASILGGASGDLADSTVSQMDIKLNGTENVDLYLDGVNVTEATETDATTTAQNLKATLDTLQTNGSISSAYKISQSGDTVTITRNDGQDINLFTEYGDGVVSVAENGNTPESITASVNSFVANESHHGTVTITDDATVTFTGDSSTLEAFGVQGPSGGVNTITSTSSGSIADAEVRTYEAAQITIDRADAALEQLDAIRSGLGSTQNQLESTVRNISVTQQNVTASESGIRDVDFAAESANFAKFQVLAQSGSFAMAQSNASLQNVLRLLQ